MIGRLYSVAIGSQSQSAAPRTLIEVTGASDSVTLWERVWITQTDFDTSENIGMKLEDMSAGGSGGSTVTPQPFQEGDAAFGGTVDTNQGSEGIYSGVVYLELGFNVLSGLLWTPANDDEVICISPSQINGVTLDVAPSASMNMSYGCTLREIGG